MRSAKSKPGGDGNALASPSLLCQPDTALLLLTYPWTYPGTRTSSIPEPSEQGPQGDLVFQSIVDSYITDPRFLRRESLAAEVTARLAAPDCRFVLLTAEPGFGKSVFMAQLAADHPDWPRYLTRVTSAGRWAAILLCIPQLAHRGMEENICHP